MASDLTVLQIARRIADAVESALDGGDCGEVVPRSFDDSRDPGAQAVLRVLHETGSWLSRWESELPADTAEPAEDEPTQF